MADTQSFAGKLTAADGPATVSPDKPRRNLTQAFEALCVDSTDTTTVEETVDDSSKGSKQQAFFSPTSVAQQLEPQTPPPSKVLHHQKASTATSTSLPPYEFNLHRDLGRDLPAPLISRVSLYAVIHDINKEATAMAANDPQNKEEHNKEELSPLVQAVTGTEATEEGPEVKTAMIDEETWLLDAISTRNREGKKEVQACPATFLQAMGEKEYENPVHALSGASRTQLWKPSRSWWEAKSGKNPWIEPNSHNKRWRYLWPFIHYHKFLAKCIKKLKRNGADVKHSVSPVAVFLREEVCSVSDHLAAVSLFGSDEWMSCLHHFTGWTAENAEDVLLAHIRQLKLRPLNEPGDVDSPLLRSQIDEHFLKAMAAQREQLREIPTTIEAPKKAKGQPPVYPRSSTSAAAVAAAAAAAGSPPPMASSGLRRPRYGPPQQQSHGQQYWNGAGYEQQQMPYGDNSSVQSGISTESGFAPTYTEYAPPHHMPHQQQYPPYYSAPPMYGPGGGSQYPMEHHQEMYHQMGPPHQHHPGWLDPALASYGVQPSVYFAEVPPSPSTVENGVTVEKEEKEDHTSEVTPQLKTSPQHSPPHGSSPFWSHLVDGATQSLVTPAKSPATPSRSPIPSCHSSNHSSSIAAQTLPEDSEGRAPMAAQPLLLRGYAYGYHYGARDGYAPPSPATQFLMPPTGQNNFYYGGYNYSPSSHRKSPKGSSGGVPPTPVRKMVDIVNESPNTVETCTESASLHETPAN